MSKNGDWYYYAKNQYGLWQWLPLNRLILDRSDKLKMDCNLGIGDSPSLIVDYILDLVNVGLPSDFISYLRGHAKSIAGEMIGWGVSIKADGNVVEGLGHNIILENVEHIRP